MVSIKLALLSLAAATTSFAYNNNCNGSQLTPSRADCEAAIRNINPSGTYGDGAQFSSGHCYLVYATNGSGSQLVAGTLLRNVANDILNSCPGRKGSFGTGNCDQCHMTMNYRG